MSDIARLILAQGQAAADARRASGARWGQIVSSAASLPLQVQQQEARSQSLALQQQREARLESAAQSEQQLRAAQLAQAQKQAEQQSASDAIIGSALTPEGKIDRAKVQELATAHGQGHLVPGIFSTIDKWDAASEDLKAKQTKGQTEALTLADKQRDHLGGVGSDLKALDYDPGTFSILVAKGVKDGLLEKEVGDQLIGKAHEDPNFVKTIADGWIAQSPTQRKAADEALKQRELQQKVEGTTPITPFQQKELDAKGTMTPYQKAELGIQGERLKLDQKKSAAEGRLDTEALDIAALNYKLSGSLPTRLNEADKTAVINRAGHLNADDIARLSTGGGNIAVNKGELRADTGSLGALQKVTDASRAAEKTLSANFDAFKKSAGNVLDVGSPLFNAPLRNIMRNLVGSEAKSAFDVYRQTVATEYGKIISSPAGGGSLPEGARHEAEAVIRGDATLKELISVGEALKTDARNKTREYDAQIKEIQGRMEHRGGGSGEAPSKATKRYNPATGKVEDIK